MRLRELFDAKPPGEHKTWKKYLTTCTLLERCRGVSHYRDDRKHYLVFPCGTITQSLSIQAGVLLADVKAFGPEAALNQVKSDNNEIQRQIAEFKKGLTTK